MLFFLKEIDRRMIPQRQGVRKMRIRVLVLIVLLSLWTFSIARAEDPGKLLPNLVGTWVTTVTGHSLKGAHKLLAEMKITSKNGAHFKGVHSWEHVEKQKLTFNVGGKDKSKAAEPVLGIIGFDGKAIYIVEHGDWGVFHWRLVDPDTIESVYLESGPHAAISRAIYKRKK
jgi:hypothetical protein